MVTRENFAGLASAAVVQARCPSCLHFGVFTAPFAHDALSNTSETLSNVGAARQKGVRICPNPECGRIIFVVLNSAMKVVQQYPPATIQFDTNGMPSGIVDTFREALLCQSNGCYRAAAIMVRRTLEELCADQKAEGSNLQKRITALGEVMVIPAALLRAANELRLFGNDAAHLQAKLYDQIGREEIEAAIKLCVELLKAAYQYTSLIDELTRLQTKISSP